MTTPRVRPLDALRQTVFRHGADLTDGQLLDLYVTCKDERAFEALVRRHGPMVLGVCRRVLANPHDVEDAFQATFLVLVRKAASVRGDALGNWLYGVAYRAAQKAKVSVARRRVKERQIEPFPEPATVAEGLWHDVLPLLDRELARLPEKYRLPVVLCDLEGRTRKEAARQLGWPEGTVAGRLAEGRARLAKGLRRHGLPVSGGVVVALLAQNATAAVPLALVQSVGKRPVTNAVAALTQGVLRSMMLTKRRLAAVVLVLGVLGGGAARFSQPLQQTPLKAAGGVASEKKVEVAWGKPVNGLQAGIRFREKRRTYAIGETATFVVKVRNVSKEPIELGYSGNLFWETVLTVQDAAGRRLTTEKPPRVGLRHVVNQTLKPGEEMVFGDYPEAAKQFSPVSLHVLPGSPPGQVHVGQIFAVPGKYQVGYDGLRFREPNQETLSTGTLELEVTDTKKVSPAWGRAVHGLRAGVEFSPGQAKAYRVGEAVTLRVLLQNVSGKPYKLAYQDGFVWENPPTVLDSRGQPATVSKFPRLGGLWRRLERVLAADEVLVLGSVRFTLARPGEKSPAGRRCT
jgi:RNA polymerase sigma factor (sigma-70 family)